MPYNPSPIEGKQHQIREMMYNRIIAAFPNKANSPDLLYGDIEAVYYDLLNSKSISIDDYAHTSKRVYLDNYLTSNVSHTTALKNAIAASAGKTLVIGSTPLTLVDVIDIALDDVSVDARGSSLTLVDDGSATGRIIRFINCSRGSWIGGKITQTASSRTGVYGLLSASNVQDLTVDSPICIGGSSTSFYGELMNGFLLHNIRGRDSKADGIHISRGSKNGHISSPRITNAADDAVAIVSVNTQAQCENITISNPIVNSLVTLGAGVAFVGPKNCSLIGGIIDDPVSSGVKITDDTVTGTHVPSNITVTGTRVRAVTDGYVIGNSTDVTMNNVSSDGGTGVGILLSGATRAHVVGGKIRGHADVGVFSTGGSGNNLIGVDLRGNTGGASAGTTHTLTSCITV